MSDRASSDLPPPERSGETLWVVDVTAPLAPGRVRWVAGEAAARLQLPAEKLVALLENRIGPVTKPLPKASADRVAEVLDLAGAEVSIRAAGPADGGRASVEGREARDPGSHEAPPASVPERASERASAPESEPASRPASEPVSDAAPEPPADITPDGAPDAAAPDAAAPDGTHDAAPDAASDPAVEPPTRRDVEAKPEVAADASTDADVEPHAEVDGDEVRVRAQAQAAPSLAGTPPTDDAPAETEGLAADTESLPPVGRPGAARRDPAARDEDPWQSLEDDEDEAMLGAWTHRTGSAPTDAVAGAGQRAVPRAAPPAASPGGRAPEAAAPAFDPNDSPPVVVDRDEDDEEDDDEGWTYGLRDPFAEAERRERAVRRWALAVSLLVALGIFLVLQWAYSRPGPDERTPPPYAAGLTAYREGSFVSAARAWAPRAEAGDTDAMFMLGWMAEYGQGRPWSNREAAGWYAQAAQRGHAPSQLRLADLYAQGLGVAFDPDVATRWYLAAAQAGLPRAQREAALAMAREGRHAEAAAWLDSAAVHDPDAAAWLALMDAARTLNLRSE